jgi:hypothetical protein
MPGVWSRNWHGKCMVREALAVCVEIVIMIVVICSLISLINIVQFVSH